VDHILKGEKLADQRVQTPDMELAMRQTRSF
jgi:hypothetical protein